MLKADSRVAGEVITVVVGYDPLQRGIGERPLLEDRGVFGEIRIERPCDC